MRRISLPKLKNFSSGKKYKQKIVWQLSTPASPIDTKNNI